MPYLLGKLGLRSTGLGKAEIVKSKVSRYMRLIVTLEQRLRPSGTRPFGEAFAPPPIILWNGMILRQVERDQPHFRFCTGGNFAPTRIFRAFVLGAMRRQLFAWGGLCRNCPAVDLSRRPHVATPQRAMVGVSTGDS